MKGERHHEKQTANLHPEYPEPSRKPARSPDPAFVTSIRIEMGSPPFYFNITWDIVEHATSIQTSLTTYNTPTMIILTIVRHGESTGKQLQTTAQLRFLSMTHFAYAASSTTQTTSSPVGLGLPMHRCLPMVIGSGFQTGRERC